MNGFSPKCAAGQVGRQLVDVVSPEIRSRMMAGIRGKDTQPETTVRQLLHRAGFRFRLHRRDLPGTPDLVLPAFGAVIFVHGCFWHGHECLLFRWPSSRPEFWRAKIDRNRQLDRRALRLLAEQSWRVATVWECALKGPGRRPPEEITSSIEAWLRSRAPALTVSAQRQSARTNGSK